MLFGHDLLPEMHQDLLFSGNCIGGAKLKDRIQYLVMVMYVRSQEVVIGDPQGQIAVRSFDSIEAIGLLIRRFVGAVELFNDLLIRTKFSCYGIAVCQADHLGDNKLNCHILKKSALNSRYKVMKLVIPLSIGCAGFRVLQPV
jgi:hypothetical protein